MGDITGGQKLNNSVIYSTWCVGTKNCKSNVMKHKKSQIDLNISFSGHSIRQLEKICKKNLVLAYQKKLFTPSWTFGTQSARQWHIKNNGHSGGKIETSKDVINIDIACHFDLMYWIPFSIIVFFACCKFFSTSVWTFRPLWYFDCFVF